MGKRYESNIADACEEWSKICGANKNLYRTMMSMIDGLKPVERRILYSLWDGPYRNTMQKMVMVGSGALRFHPHGETSAQDAAVNLAKERYNNVCVIYGKGNFGSTNGDGAGAARYINGKLSEYAIKCFFEDLQDSNVDMKLSYSGHDMEPEFLPARYPHALFNGSLGIGYGMASNVPPYNVKEVLKTTITFHSVPSI
jgi:DNA gyrase/topoisomerase IV subunit A